MLSIQGGNSNCRAVVGAGGGEGKKIAKGTAELYIISIPSITRATLGLIYNT